eukprot:CAMPEP_0170285696 /NCGR_PEP_ID=MMETSP0116_2-20130129/42902_1 /TAXON_ID=400756 /ORGANISM="Durinskia baltica, Strain CSIRO CS-38" /LENGTH=218 /DNA_ID=CAMNT_0010537107 /DNA_START=57 /DNA_END=710 /DNA_ORIENTATION=-
MARMSADRVMPQTFRFFYRCSACSELRWPPRVLDHLPSTSFVLDGVPLSRLTLRFHDAGLERGFRNGLANRSLDTVFYVNAVLFLLFALFLCLYPFDAESYTTDEHHRIAVRCGVANIGVGGSALLIAVAAKLQQRWRLLHPLAVEVLATLTCSVQLVICIFTDEWYMAKAMGLDPHQVMKKVFTDSWIVLAIDTALTVAHFVFAVRWAALWPFTLMG